MKIEQKLKYVKLNHRKDSGNKFMNIGCRVDKLITSKIFPSFFIFDSFEGYK